MYSTIRKLPNSVPENDSETFDILDEKQMLYLDRTIVRKWPDRNIKKEQFSLIYSVGCNFTN